MPDEANGFVQIGGMAGGSIGRHHGRYKEHLGFSKEEPSDGLDRLSKRRDVMMKHQLRILLVVLSGFLLLDTTVLAQDFHGCPIEGKGGDPALNRLKNRSEMPASFEPIDFEELTDLEVPAGVSKKPRAQWSRATLATLERPEKRAVQVVGYLLGVKLEGREATNCGSDAPEERDFHVWLANSPDDDRLDAVVVEVTPRVRAQHPSWSLTNLRRFVRQQSRVRISGWLMLDEGHPEQVGKTRVTLWEIHPILRIDVWSAGSWRELP